MSTTEKKGLIRLIIVGIYYALLIAAIVLFCCKAYLVCSIILFLRIVLNFVDSTFLQEHISLEERKELLHKLVEHRPIEDKPIEGKVKELQALARPLNDWLQNNGNPHQQIIITFDGVEWVEGRAAAPYDIKD